MLKNKNFHKNKYYKMAFFNFFKDKKIIFLTYLSKNKIYVVLVSLILIKNWFMIYLLSQEIS